MDRIQSILNSPVISVLMGLALVVTSAQEVWATSVEELGSLQSHHGILVFGIFTLLKSVLHLVEGLVKTLERTSPER